MTRSPGRRRAQRRAAAASAAAAVAAAVAFAGQANLGGKGAPQPEAKPDPAQHIALAVHEELDLHHRLLVIRFDSIRSDPIRSGSRAARVCRSRPEPARRTRGAAQDDLEDAVEHTGGRLSLAQNRLKILMRKSSECKARRRGSDPRIRIRQAGG